jgi:hypothetical protein
LISIVVIGFLFFDTQHCFNDKESCVANTHNDSINYYQSASLVTVAAWLKANEGAINAFSAIATLMFTGVIATFTAVLASKTSGVHIETAAMRAVMAKQRSDMLRSIAAAEKSADAAKIGAELAREEFFSTHRPHLTIRDLFVDGEKIRFLLINKGESPANIIESWIFTEYIIDAKSIRPLFSSGHNDIGRFSLEAGEIQQINWPLGEIGFNIRFPTAGKAVKVGDLTSFPKGHSHLAITIVYAGATGQKRRSVFRRRWNSEIRSFERIDDPDQEYSD